MSAEKPTHRRSVVQKWVKETYPDEELWTYAEIADFVGRDSFTVRRWVREGLLDPPTKYGYMGDNLVYLLTYEDVQRFLAYSKKLKPGRRSKVYTAELSAVGKNPRATNNASTGEHK